MTAVKKNSLMNVAYVERVTSWLRIVVDQNSGQKELKNESLAGINKNKFSMYSGIIVTELLGSLRADAFLPCKFYRSNYSDKKLSKCGCHLVTFMFF